MERLAGHKHSILFCSLTERKKTGFITLTPDLGGLDAAAGAAEHLGLGEGLGSGVGFTKL